MKKNNGNMKHVLITGASGGMGRSAAEILSGKGYTVFALDRSPMENPPEGVIPITADVTDSESVIYALTEIKKHTDQLYGILHFAGIYMLDSLIEMSEEEFERIFRVNLQGAFLINKTFAPMLTQGSRILITTSELAPLHPLPFTGVYAVSRRHWTDMPTLSEWSFSYSESPFRCYERVRSIRECSPFPQMPSTASVKKRSCTPATLSVSR